MSVVKGRMGIVGASGFIGGELVRQASEAGWEVVGYSRRARNPGDGVAEWREWSQGTPAVVPRKLPVKRLTDTSWSAHQSLIRNGELYITIYLAACAAWLWYRAFV